MDGVATLLHHASLYFTRTANGCFIFLTIAILPIFAAGKMVVIAQLVRASDCGSEGRRFEPG
jgi:hypothetical protein